MNTMTQEINMKRLLLLIATVLLGLYAVHGVPQEPEDGLASDRVVADPGFCKNYDQHSGQEHKKQLEGPF